MENIYPITLSSKMIQRLIAGKKISARFPLSNQNIPDPQIDSTSVKPPYKTGDTLFVCEPFRKCSGTHISGVIGEPRRYFTGIEYSDSSRIVSCDANTNAEESPELFASANILGGTFCDSFTDNWNSPKSMTQNLSRLSLTVKNIRIERLQDITVEGILDEGFSNEVALPPVCELAIKREKEGYPCGYPLGYDTWSDERRDEWNKNEARAVYIGWTVYADTLFKKFQREWNEECNEMEFQNQESLTWDSNPWVWVVEFEHIKCRAKPSKFDGCCRIITD